MAKGDATQLVAMVTAHVQELVELIANAMRRNLAEELSALIVTPAGGRASRRLLPCMAPGCSNPSKGPRFHYLCDEHKGAKKSLIVAWRQARKLATKRPAR
jgi:hypothetical protein